MGGTGHSGDFGRLAQACRAWLDRRSPEAWERLETEATRLARRMARRTFPLDEADAEDGARAAVARIVAWALRPDARVRADRIDDLPAYLHRVCRNALADCKRRQHPDWHAVRDRICAIAAGRAPGLALASWEDEATSDTVVAFAEWRGRPWRVTRRLARWDTRVSVEAFVRDELGGVRPTLRGLIEGSATDGSPSLAVLLGRLLRWVDTPLTATDLTNMVLRLAPLAEPLPPPQPPGPEARAVAGAFFDLVARELRAYLAEHGKPRRASNCVSWLLHLPDVVRSGLLQSLGGALEATRLVTIEPERRVAEALRARIPDLDGLAAPRAYGRILPYPWLYDDTCIAGVLDDTGLHPLPRWQDDTDATHRRVVHLRTDLARHLSRREEIAAWRLR